MTHLRGQQSTRPRPGHGLRGPRGNDAGGHPQSDLWPPNTEPPLETTATAGGHPTPVRLRARVTRTRHGARARQLPGRHVVTPVLTQCTQNERGFWKTAGPGSSPIPTLTSWRERARPRGSAPPLAEHGPPSRHPWGALHGLCCHEAGPLTVPTVQRRKQARRGDRHGQETGTTPSEAGLRVLSAPPNGKGACRGHGPPATVLTTITAVTAVALRLTRRGWAASSGLTFDSPPDQGHIHGTDGKFSPDAKTGVNRLKDQIRKG